MHFDSAELIGQPQSTAQWDLAALVQQAMHHSGLRPAEIARRTDERLDTTEAIYNGRRKGLSMAKARIYLQAENADLV